VRSVVAFVPASEHDLRPLAGHPLIDYTIFSACETGLFTKVIVATESVPALMRERSEDAFAILRPTSPFRTAATIRRAWERLLELADRADSLSAVERCQEHPAKMWQMDGELMRPVLARPGEGTPWHSLPYQTLPQVWVQTSSLEMAWRHVLDLAVPARIAPFLIEGAEAFSVDSPEDFERAQGLVERGEAKLPRIPEIAL
jgi:N-acylneuraminate cytidylyltransferase